MNRFTILVLIIVMVKHESLGQDDDDDKPHCTHRKAVPYSTDTMRQLNNNWFVNRLTIMKQLPSSVKNTPTENCCNPLTYLADCKGEKPIGGIHIYREVDTYGNIVKITKAYSDKFKNIAEFWEKQNISDNDPYPKFIFAGSLIYMFLHPSATEVHEIKSPNFPPLIRFAADREFAILYYQPNFEWVHYIDCDNEVSWIEITEAVVNEKRVEAINKEIDQYLANNPHTPKMELIPLVLPFKV